jgi:hypothetical protein
LFNFLLGLFQHGPNRGWPLLREYDITFSEDELEPMLTVGDFVKSLEAAVALRRSRGAYGAEIIKNIPRDRQPAYLFGKVQTCNVLGIYALPTTPVPPSALPCLSSFNSFSVTLNSVKPQSKQTRSFGYTHTMRL